MVRQLDDDVKKKLQRRARRNGRSTEEEVREILRNAVRDEGGSLTPLGSRIAARFRRVGLGGEIEELRGKVAFFELADRLAHSSDYAEQKQLKEELAQLTFVEP